jgi:hypothetical protein
VKMKLAWGLALALSGVEANNCDVTQSDTCPCSDVKWKKAKVGGKAASKIEKRGATSIEMRMGIANTIIDRDANRYPEAYQADWTFRHPTYGKNKGNIGVLDGTAGGVGTPKRYNPNMHIFVQWSRQNCGIDFLNAIENGDITFDAMDQYDVYNTRDMKTYYNKWEGQGLQNKYHTQILQFKTENPEEDGHTLNAKAAVDDGNWKKDLLYLWIHGIDKVATWKGNDMDACLHSAYIAILEIGNGISDADTDYTQCVAESMILW